MIFPGTPRRSASLPMKKPGMSWRKRRGTLKESQRQRKEMTLSAVGVAGPRLVHGLIGDDADDAPADAGERGDDGAAEARLELEQQAAVHDARNDPAHVVGACARLRHQVGDAR